MTPTSDSTSPPSARSGPSSGQVRRCRRCQATDNLRLEESYTVWNETMASPQQRNVYVCIDRKQCSARLHEALSHLKEAELWANYYQDRRKRRYTPRKYWNDGRRLTFALAQALFAQAGMTLERGRSDFPQGLKSGYIINREWRFTSLLEAIKLLEADKAASKGKEKRPCRRQPAAQ